MTQYVGIIEWTSNKINVTPYATNNFINDSWQNGILVREVYHVLASGKNIIVDSGSASMMYSNYGISNKNLFEEDRLVIPSWKPFGARTMWYRFNWDIFELFIPAYNTEKEELSLNGHSTFRPWFDNILLESKEIDWGKNIVIMVEVDDDCVDAFVTNSGFSWPNDAELILPDLTVEDKIVPEPIIQDSSNKINLLKLSEDVLIPDRIRMPRELVPGTKEYYGGVPLEIVDQNYKERWFDEKPYKITSLSGWIEIPNMKYLNLSLRYNEFMESYRCYVIDGKISFLLNWYERAKSVW